MSSALQTHKPGRTTITGIRGAGSAWLTTTLSKNQPICCILSDEQMVDDFQQDLKLFTTRDIIGYPGYEIPPYTPLSPDQRTTAARISALYRIAENRHPVILVISIEAILRRAMSRKSLLDNAELLMEGEDFDLSSLRSKLATLGYDSVSLVKSIGDFSVRGGILDVFPPSFLLPDGTIHEGPIRLDFFGDTIESIKSFEPLSQRSNGQIEEIILLPVSDILLPDNNPGTLRKMRNSVLNKAEYLNWDSIQTAEITERLQSGQRFPGIEFFLPLLDTNETPTSSVVDYLPENTIILLDDITSIKRQGQLISERIHSNFLSAQDANNPALPPDELFITPEDLNTALEPFSCFETTDFISEHRHSLEVRSKNHQLLKQEISLRRKNEGLLVPLVERISSWLDNGDRAVICCRSERRRNTLAELLSRFDLSLTPLQPPLDTDSLTSTSDKRELFLIDAPLSKGFSLTDKKIHLLSENELFGEMRLGSRKKTPKKPGETINFAELTDGDIVVHREHGLGIYSGLVTIELQKVINDFMLIEYREGDKLYLPIDRLNLISKYEGLSDKKPKIDKLGSQSWKATKQKVSDEVWKVAHELLDIYARRELQAGRAFSAPSELYRELEESFPYDETPGQFKAINETIDDLTSDRAMDRLICGDVGYGKTEVAIRGAFKVIEDGYQVAILVPTTVLAEQHAKTFKERLQGLPVTIECLNRFKSPSVQKRIVKELSEGSVDIVIATHRLLSKDVSFKRLGLMIIDEEHRFGVAHKEKNQTTESRGRYPHTDSDSYPQNPADVVTRNT